MSDLSDPGSGKKRGEKRNMFKPENKVNNTLVTRMRGGGRNPIVVPMSSKVQPPCVENQFSLRLFNGHTWRNV